MSNQAEQHRFIDVSDMNDVPAGKMKHVEVEEKELLIRLAKFMRYVIGAVT